MSDLSGEIDSLSNFKRKTAGFIRQVKQSGEPLILTVNGKAEIIVQDARSYQALRDRLRRTEDLFAIREGLDQANRGEGRPASEVFADLQSKHGL